MKLWQTRRRMLRYLAAAGSFALTEGRSLSDPIPATIGLMRCAESGPLYIAAAKQFFKDEGLDIELRFYESEPLIAKAVANGEAAFGVASLSGSFFASAADEQLQFIASQFSDQAGFPANALVINRTAFDAGLRSGRDLQHKTIGVSSLLSGACYAVHKIALKYGWDPAGVTLAPEPLPEKQIEALSKGKIAAAILPYLTALNLRASLKDALVVRLSDIVESQQGVIFTTRDSTRHNAAFVNHFIRAYQRGVADYDLNFLQRDDGGEVLKGADFNNELHLIAEQAHLMPDLLEKGIPYCDRLARVDEADTESQLKFWQDRGIAGKKVDISDLLDPSFTRETLLTISSHD